MAKEKNEFVFMYIVPASGWQSDRLFPPPPSAISKSKITTFEILFVIVRCIDRIQCSWFMKQREKKIPKYFVANVFQVGAFAFIIDITFVR